MSGNRNQDYVMRKKREMKAPDVKWRAMYVALDAIRYHHLVKNLRKQGIEVMTQAEVYQKMKGK